MREVIIGALIGGIIGFFSAFALWKCQIKYDKKNLARGFDIEISSLESKIKLYARAFDTPGPGAGLVKIEQTLYNNGLFFDCRKEISSFDRDLSDTLFEFYTYLLTAERDRKIDSSDIYFKQANDEMKSSIKKACEILPKLKELLKHEYE